jgi:serine/threonine-protein kinase
MADTTLSGFGPVWKAIRGDAMQLELNLARAQQIIAACAGAVALYFSAMVRSDLGLPLVGFSFWVFLWFTLAREWMRRGWATKTFALVNPLVEILVPGVVMLLLTRVEGPEYTLGSWVPPQMYAVYIMGSVLRLRPMLPAVMGALAAVQYFTVYMVAVRPGVSDTAPLWAGDEVQAVRMFTLILMGLAGSAAVIAFRRMVDRAAGSVRSRDLFGKYVLGEAIASGGMGTVFEATYCPEGGFQRRVAIKRIHPHLAANKDFVGRFRHEAELCARLAHPNIVAALDFGRVEDSYFFAMEFIDGVMLTDVLAHRRMTQRPIHPAVVCWVGRQVLEGLGYAHAGARDADGQLLHVVHRDLSPHNVLLDRSGLVKISDFGVARALRGAHDMHTANLAGKPAYMAPEQLRKTAIDERSDLFSVAVVLWEALTNQRLFFRDNEAATMLAVLDFSVPAPSSVRTGLNVAWDAFFTRALAKASDKRFQTAVGMSNALARLQEVAGSAGPEDVAALVDESHEDALEELVLE